MSEHALDANVLKDRLTNRAAADNGHFALLWRSRHFLARLGPFLGKRLQAMFHDGKRGKDMLSSRDRNYHNKYVVMQLSKEYNFQRQV